MWDRHFALADSIFQNAAYKMQHTQGKMHSAICTIISNTAMQYVIFILRTTYRLIFKKSKKFVFKVSDLYSKLKTIENFLNFLTVNFFF